MMKNKSIYLVTGSAGFIGFHVCKMLLKKKYNVIGIDNINRYYDIDLKLNRLIGKSIFILKFLVRSNVIHELG